MTTIVSKLSIKRDNCRHCLCWVARISTIHSAASFSKLACLIAFVECWLDLVILNHLSFDVTLHANCLKIRTRIGHWKIQHPWPTVEDTRGYPPGNQRAFVNWNATLEFSFDFPIIPWNREDLCPLLNVNKNKFPVLFGEIIQFSQTFNGFSEQNA